MSKNIKYWKGLEDLNNDPEFLKSAQNEFAEEIPMDQFLGNESLDSTSTPRRDFLKFLGFSVTAASLAACETPVRRVIPYVIKPEEITPGVPNWYASSFFDGHDYCSILVKTREGRPIKVEGNKTSKISRGGTNARVQASVLSLYDSARLSGPMAKGNISSWSAIDKDIKNKLEEISGKGGNIRILSSTVISPSTKQIIAEFSEKFKNTAHVTYDAISYSGIIQANKASFGKAVVPSYNFENAHVIVSFGADFLNSWLSPIEFASQYAMNRKVGREKKEMSKHIQFESNLSLTGSNADERIAIKQTELGHAVLGLYKALGGNVNAKSLPADAKIKDAAKHLMESKEKAVVVCGSNDPNIQMVVNAINEMIGSYGSTIDLNKTHNLKQGNDTDLTNLVAEMKDGKVDALFMYNVNPSYTLPASIGFGDALKKVGLKVSFADRADETASACDYICPDHHIFESWGDANPKAGHYSLIQPVIFPLFSTRAAQESLLTWMGNSTDYQTYVANFWEKNLFPMQQNESAFSGFWAKVLFDGVFEAGTTPAAAEPLTENKPKENKEASKEEKPVEAVSAAPAMDLSSAAENIAKTYGASGEFELVMYEKAGLGNGSQANNPWLQELPDPVSKVTWDNYLTMNPADMKAKGLNLMQRADREASLVEITANGIKIPIPVYPQPGQALGTVGLALGYGRTMAGKAGNEVGKNAYPFLSMVNGNLSYFSPSATVSGENGKYSLAATQTHHTMMGRAIVKEASLSEYKKDPKAGNETELFSVQVGQKHTEKTAEQLDLWATAKYPGHDKPGHFWGMAIDLNSCIGCGACVISCNAENNVPVVGKKEVMMSREMHWIRIDRYYSSEADPKGHHDEKNYTAMEDPENFPKVAFQPVMCQHCNHAPCETVCPVAATTHSGEGLNMMAYNRCVGTRYCANNCPYKVRRFNWFKYSDNGQFNYNMNDELGKMVLNPDVVVRSRGVMEKCTMCVQRIQEGKLNAKREARKLKDGEILTACAQACPTNAIVFGDYNNPESELARLKEDERMYHLLEEINVQPSVYYLTKIRNAEENTHNEA